MKNLSSRELEVVKLAAVGKTADEIALIMGVCTSTVKQHRCRISEKLDIYNIVALTHWAIANKHVELMY